MEKKLYHDHEYHRFHGLYIIDLHRQGGDYMFRCVHRKVSVLQEYH